VTDEQLIVVDNTHTRKWEMEKWQKLAEEQDYRVFVLHVEAEFWDAYSRMKHGVPFDKFQEMSERWEPVCDRSQPTRLNELEAQSAAMVQFGRALENINSKLGLTDVQDDPGSDS
jgi:hypothetical protein